MTTGELKSHPYHQEGKSLNEHVKDNRCIFFLAFFSVGIFNNNGYHVVQAGASDVAKQFKMDSFMAVFLFAMIFFGGAARIINGTCLVKWPHLRRVCLFATIQFCSFIGIGYSCYMSEQSDNKIFFWIAIIFSVFTGLGSGIGEATWVGFMKGYPSENVGDVASGTGFAGLFATGTVAAKSFLGIDNWLMFVIEAPTIVIYFLAFKWLTVQKQKYPRLESEELHQVNQEEYDEIMNPTDDEKTDDETIVRRGSLIGEVANNEQLNFSNFGPLFKKTARYTLSLASVYFLEYTIITSFAKTFEQKATIQFKNENPGVDDIPFEVRGLYDIVNFCYSIGVFTSRSSLKFVKIDRVEILSLLQLINFIVLGYNAYFFQVASPYILAPIFIWTGLMGGGSYVNCIHGLVSTDMLKKNEREGAISISLMMNDVGILGASILSLVLANTVFKIDETDTSV